MKIINADCIEAMKEMADNSIDAIVTDPPYELGFMGKSWDSTGIAFNIEVWQEALRVIKPGGHLIAFSGSRTYHRMAVAIEDAGFQIRDQIMWVYGSGFPKSHNISKGIDKAAGAEREVVGPNKFAGINGKKNATCYGEASRPNETAPATPAAQQWQGWGTALKPAHEPMVLARKPLEGTVANNVLTFGTGGLNIDGTRVGSEGGKGNVIEVLDEKQDKSGGWGTKNVIEDDIIKGRFPANFIHDGSDEVVALFPAVKGATSRTPAGNASIDNAMFGGGFAGPVYDDGLNTSAARFFYCAKASKRDRNEGLDEFEVKSSSELVERKEGSAGMDSPRAGAGRTSGSANHHPTVKPTDLMRYLCKLVTPPNGIVLDPFMGSGSTGKGAVLEGFEFIGIEQSAEYCDIAKARIDYVQNNLPEFAQEFLL
jgi:site-specific DNA-methyltransferase (adenine-specific)